MFVLDGFSGHFLTTVVDSSKKRNRVMFILEKFTVLGFYFFYAKIFTLMIVWLNDVIKIPSKIAK